MCVRRWDTAPDRGQCCALRAGELLPHSFVMQSTPQVSDLLFLPASPAGPSPFLRCLPFSSTGKQCTKCSDIERWHENLSFVFLRVPQHRQVLQWSFCKFLLASKLPFSLHSQNQCFATLILYHCPPQVFDIINIQFQCTPKGRCSLPPSAEQGNQEGPKLGWVWGPGLVPGREWLTDAAAKLALQVCSEQPALTTACTQNLANTLPINSQSK